MFEVGGDISTACGSNFRRPKTVAWLWFSTTFNAKPFSHGMPSMTDDFTKYFHMKDNGSTAEQVYLEATRDEIDLISRIRLIRKVFSLSLGDAKDVFLRSEGLTTSRDEFQERLFIDAGDIEGND
ncbi:MAG: hypothetical protein V4719_08870 [Planctomycetota bacterium]